MTVEKRPLGSSGIEVAPLALGGNVFGWTADEATSFDILDAFVDAGGTMIDTADVYSAWVPGHQGGESETVIGHWLKRDPAKRDKVVIATKVGFFEGLAPDKIAAACDASLQRLGIDTIDLYYQHKDDPNVPLADSLGAFDALVKAGKIRAIGLSQFQRRAARRGDDGRGSERPDPAVRAADLVQSGRAAEAGGRASRHRARARARDRPLLQPRQRLPDRQVPDQGRPRQKRRAACATSNISKGEGMRVLEALDEVAAETGAALATIALAWTIAQPGITAPLASATSVEQLEAVDRGACTFA